MSHKLIVFFRGKDGGGILLRWLRSYTEAACTELAYTELACTELAYTELVEVSKCRSVEVSKCTRSQAGDIAESPVRVGEARSQRAARIKKHNYQCHIGKSLAINLSNTYIT